MPRNGPSRPQPTHFLCLPLLTPTSTPQLARSLSRFRAATSKISASRPTASDNGRDSSPESLGFDITIPEAAYRPVGTLHLTLGVMSLSPPDRLDAALNLLQGIDLRELLEDAEPFPETGSTNRTGPQGSEERVPPISSTPGNLIHTLKRAISPPALSSTATTRSPDQPTSKSPIETRPPPLLISLAGLSAFPHASKATVIHAEPSDPTNRLQNFSLALRQHFIDARFIEAENRALVLHATLVNTVYAKRDRRGERGGRGVGRIAMDATPLLKAYSGSGGPEGPSSAEAESTGPFIWAEYIAIDRVRICKMGARKVDDEMLGQEYEVVGEKLILSNDT